MNIKRRTGTRTITRAVGAGLAVILLGTGAAACRGHAVHRTPVVHHTVVHHTTVTHHVVTHHVVVHHVVVHHR